jgi:chorismate mutase
MNANLDITPMQEWINTDGKPLIIAGPCSAETEEQVLETANRIKAEGYAHIMRAGVWKPRTRPGSFEGMGEPALKWLVEAKKQTGLPLACEVATPEHVELSLKYGVDVLWIGARTTVNPFNVQDLADALKGVDIPVLVKNPVNPDLALWVGAFERLQNSGIKKLGAIHPSHMAGKRSLLMELSQRILDLNYDGMIIETHRDPDAAWSDASQQVTPEVLGGMLRELEVRQANYGADFTDELAAMRAKIDNIDRELMEVLAARMSIVEKLGEYKRDNNVAVLQLDRWKQVHADRAKQASGLGLYPEFVEELFKLVHLESIRKQTEVMSSVMA